MATPAQRRLSQSLDNHGKLKVIRVFWNRNSELGDLQIYDRYLHYYEHETTKLLRLDKSRKHPEACLVELNHKDLLDCVRLISENRSQRLTGICNEISRIYPTIDERAAAALAKLAVRVWLTLNVREASQRRNTPQIPFLDWDEDNSLITLIEKCFVPLPIIRPSDSVEINQHLTIAYMSLACGIRVEWTSCLGAHLFYDKKRKTLQLYQHRMCLVNHFEKEGSSLRGENDETWRILPPRLLEETIWTLKLLLPPNDGSTVDFLQKQGVRIHYSGFHNAPLDLNQYRYWHDRLADFYKLHDQEPETWKEMWYRDKPEKRMQIVQFCSTVVLAFILAIIFGLISSITAILSTKAALKSVSISEKALLITEEALELQKQVPICPCP